MRQSVAPAIAVRAKAEGAVAVRPKAAAILHTWVVTQQYVLVVRLARPSAVRRLLQAQAAAEEQQRRPKGWGREVATTCCALSLRGGGARGVSKKGVGQKCRALGLLGVGGREGQVHPLHVDDQVLLAAQLGLTLPNSHALAQPGCRSWVKVMLPVRLVHVLLTTQFTPQTAHSRFTLPH